MVPDRCSPAPSYPKARPSGAPWSLRDSGRLRKAIIRRERYRCALCDAAGQVTGLDVHHIQPKGIGGSRLLDHPGNLIALCRTCHESAHRNVPRWRPRLHAIARRSVARFRYP